MKRLALATFVAGLALGACAPSDPRTPPAVRVETVTARPTSAIQRYSGTIRAETQVDVAFRAGGFVDSIASVIVETGRKSKRRVTRPLQAGDRVTRDLPLASLRLADFREKVSEAGGMSREASAGYRTARAELDRAKKLLANGSISQADYDNVKARHDAMQAGAGAAAARVGQATLALSDAHLKSPLDGILLERRVEVGSLVAPGAPAFTVADTSNVRVSFGVPDTVLGATRDVLEIGDAVSITTDAVADRSFTGHVTKIAAQADARTRVFDVEATFENPDGVLKVGMPAKIEIGGEGAAGERAILLPLAAVVRVPPNERGFWVYVLDEVEGAPHVRARAVELSRLVGNRIAVASGLAGGERVVIQGASLVTDRQRVVLVP
ncbi:MAG: efflux RND transporter periplasmic adaptor subunit [Labilithrix sp.]|nr:efflux RND transporter periplasmic adaptor subunit [Labilithrix sp.]